ncbi:MAG: restriction endonuclease subunit S [Methylococcaceae bacterium]
MEAYELESSEISWQGFIPTHWNKDKLFRLCEKMGSGGTPTSTNENYYGGNIPWIQSGDLTDGYVSVTKKTITEEALNNSSAKMFSKGTLLVAMYGATIGKLGIMEMDAATNQACCALQVSKKFFSKFTYYVLLDMRELLISEAYGGSQPNISQETLKHQYMFIPSIEEQKAIAEYLDKACQNIDKTISLKQQQLEKLEAYRKSVIHEAVTKGLDKTVTMKGSGVEWLGETPEHWKIKRIKDIAELKSGNTITSLQIQKDEGHYPVYGGNGLRGYTDSYTHNGYKVLIGRQGDLCGNINYVDGVYFATEHAVVCAPYFDLNVLWFGELLRVMNLNQYSNAAAQAGLSVGKIKRLKIPLPPKNERLAIEVYLKANNEKTEETIAVMEKQIKTLTQYRQSLIHECVTGKKRVYQSNK